MPDDRKTGKIRDAKSQLEQAMSRIYRQEPPQYSGKPLICTVCQQPMVKAIMGVKRCECRHDVRQRETKQAAMERRAHWLLKKEFDPEYAVIRDWPTDRHVAMLPPPLMHPYKFDYAKLEKRWAELNEKMTDELIYGVNAGTNNKEKP